jgi:hypothetical protein
MFMVDSSLSVPSLTQYWTIPVPGTREIYGREENVEQKVEMKECYKY